MTAQADTITCKICGHESTLAAMVRERALDGGTLEVGLMCADCEHWDHSYYTNRQLKQQQVLVAYKVAQYQQGRLSSEQLQAVKEKYRIDFERYQRECEQGQTRP